MKNHSIENAMIKIHAIKNIIMGKEVAFNLTINDGVLTIAGRSATVAYCRFRRMKMIVYTCPTGHWSGQFHYVTGQPTCPMCGRGLVVK